MTANKASFLSHLQRALQLDLFGDLFVVERKPDPKPSAPRQGLPRRPKPSGVSPNASPNPQNNSSESEGKLKKILLGDVVLEYTLRRSKRRSIGFLIGDEGLRITAPRWVNLSEIEQAILEKQEWILKHLRAKREQQSQRQASQLRFEDGATIPLLGDAFRMRFELGRSKITVDHGTTELRIQLPVDTNDPLHETMCRTRLKAWLQQQAKLIFSQRMPELAEQLGVDYKHMQLSSAGTRWGSCTSNGVIRLNWRLVHLEPDLIDYVIAHELAHRIEMNHSPAFWATVERIYPRYDEARKRLKEVAVAGLPQL
ncbi:SprT family zinc-dependent metalloprotease [Undibacterium cyanobacteriorum]|uniref:SprT family zinc-dependent metalloprotease n=1 Tax=Undibacterium cyanobacteriorum TaxID=3073561 RepID=A0ABY9RIZ3_9BURK|nr:SprT family zinc-dependent metalloprotease [Undibacterium sp. 20NA77.5]WMW80051.1 SprT family zinc-dependent metalloprotease [Undibacterium sp. 20NA77.5]